MSRFRLPVTIAVAVVLLLLVAGAASAAVTARVALDKAWLGPHDDVTARVTLTNSGPDTVWIPRWQVPRAKLDASLFEVTRDGQSVRYLGMLVKRAPAGPADLIALKSGQSLRGRTELTHHYEMTDGGEYVVAFRTELFDDAAGFASAKADGGSNAIAVWRDAPVRGNGAAIEALDATAVGQSLAFSSCSSSQQSAITSAVGNAGTYSTGAKNYLNGKTYNTVGPRYTTWFGAVDSNRFNTVKSHYVALEDAFATKPVVVDCTCTQSYYAYVYPTQPYKIYVCNAFWSAPPTGTDSKAGTLVHEMSHFNVVASTDDWAYGQTACKRLAKKPAKAIDNADSHEYFAENTPAQN
jgi:peptidyl-Lys metalloendopeptidase